MATKSKSSATRKLMAKKPNSNAKTVTSTVKVASTTKKSVTKLFKPSSSRTAFMAALVAEFIGTFLLATAYITSQGQPLYILFALVGIVLFIGTISGAHVNPAVTISAWITKKVRLPRAVGYIVAQFLGALLALVILGAFVGGAEQPSTEAALYGQAAPSLFAASDIVAGKEWYLFFSEVIGTLILGFAVASVFSKKKDRISTAFTIGLGVFVALLISYTCASYVGGTAILNPAVALSLDALVFTPWPLAIYVAGPIIGGLFGFLLHNLIRVKESVK